MQSIQVIDRAFSVLEAIAGENGAPQSLGAIARAVGLNPSTCARILATMAKRGYVEQFGHKGRYVLGPMAGVLARGYSVDAALVARAEGPMLELSAELGEPTLLAVLRAGRRVVLHEVRPDTPVQVMLDPRQSFDPLASATGRLLAAQLDADEQSALISERRLPSPSWPGIDGPEALRAALGRIRRDGRCIRKGEGDVVGLAFPVFEEDRMIAALGVYMPAFRFAGARGRNVIRRAEEAARGISWGKKGDSDGRGESEVVRKVTRGRPRGNRAGGAV